MNKSQIKDKIEENNFNIETKQKIILTLQNEIQTLIEKNRQLQIQLDNPTLVNPSTLKTGQIAIIKNWSIKCYIGTIIVANNENLVSIQNNEKYWIKEIYTEYPDAKHFGVEIIGEWNKDTPLPSPPKKGI